jgi:diguanylate cyclase
MPAAPPRPDAAHAPPIHRRDAAAELVVAAVAALMVGLLFGLHGRVSAVTLLLVAAFGAPAAVVGGLRRRRPRAAGPWLLVGLGAGLLAGAAAVRAADGAYAAMARVATPARPVLPDALTLAGLIVVLFGLGLLGSSSLRPARRGPAPLLEAALAGVVAFSISWSDWAGRATGPGGARWSSAAFMVLGLPLAAALVALTLVGSARAPWRLAAGRRLVAGAAVLAASIVLVQLEETGRRAPSAGWVEAGVVLAAAGFALAALHPSMRQLSLRDRRLVTARPPWVRVGLSALGALVPIAVLLARSPQAGRPVALSVAALAAVLLGATRALLALRAGSGGEARLAHQVTHDPLTGLANRTLLEDWIGEALRYARPSTHVAAILFDVDHFKAVNDAHGYAHGDQLLVELARRLEATAGADALVARLGGDEFVVAVRAADEDAVRHSAERLQGALGAPFLLYRAEVFASASIGVALAAPGDPMATAETLIRDADTAMYQAKDAGRDTLAFFDASMRDRIADRLALEADLRIALEREEFRLFYQPILSLGTPSPEVVGLEALLRWDRPTRGLVPPSLFVAVAEESGLMVEIGEWALREACRALAAWRRSVGAEDLFVSVNLSALQLKNASLLRKLRGALTDGGLAADSLCVEVAEAALSEHPADGAAFLLRLKELGVRIAIDDFGAGYSSLAYLKQFPVDFVKIHHSFVAGLAHPDATDETLVAAIVAMAESLDVRTIGKGVEDEVQDQTLRSLGVDLAQGFLYSRPVPAERVGDTLRALAPRHGLRLVTGDGAGGPPAR